MIAHIHMSGVPPPSPLPPSLRFQPCLLKVVRLLERLVRSQDIPPDYVYYGVASPWLQARLQRTRRGGLAPRQKTSTLVIPRTLRSTPLLSCALSSTALPRR